MLLHDNVRAYLSCPPHVRTVLHAVQHGVQRTAGILRDLQAFFTPQQNPALKQSPCPPSRR